MENWTYEKDFTNEAGFTYPSADEKSKEFVRELEASPEYQRFIAKLHDKMASIPVVEIPEAKENFHFLLEKCEQLAKERRGSIKAIIEYEQKNEAKIYLTFPNFVEFDNDNLQLLGELSKRAGNVVFETGEGNTIQMKVHIDFFEDGVAEDGTTYDELAAKSMEPFLRAMGAETSD